MNEHVIQTANLTKQYGNIKAVDNVSLSIRRGEIFGLLGPNGAGKTTTINILIGLSLPSSGTAKIAGLDVTKHSVEIKKSLGIAAQEAYFDHHLSIKDNLFYHGLLYGLPRKELKKRVDTALQWCKLEKYRNKKLFIFILGIGLGKRVVIGDVNYLYFLAPGILFMVVVNNSYMTISMRLMMARDWDKTLITALSAPIRPVEIVLGYMLAGVTQALAACTIFIVLMNYFLGVPVGSISLIVLLIIATAAFFSSLAVAISMVLDNPYHLMVVTSLVVVPMSFFLWDIYTGY